MWEYNYTNELCHHGVLGMHWGIRKARRSSSIGALKKQKRKVDKDVNKENKKIYKYTMKSTSAFGKAAKLMYKSSKKETPDEKKIGKANKLKRKAYKYASKVAKNKKKYNRSVRVQQVINKKMSEI